MKIQNAQGLKYAQSVLRAVTVAAVAILAYSVWDNSQKPVAAKHNDRPDPWRGLPGCLWVGTGDKQRLWPVTAGDAKACGFDTGKAPQVLSAEEKPQHSQALLNSLQPYIAAPAHSRAGVLAREPATSQGDYPNATYRQQTIGARQVQRGHSLYLTLDMDGAQRRAQQVANCTTGQLEDCKAAGIPADRWNHHFESAGARMAALIQIDLRSGAIEAIASAHTPCFAADAMARAIPAGCPNIAHRPRKPEPWRLENASLYTQERLGSMVKPLEVLTLLRSKGGDKYLHGADAAWLAQVLKKSDTQALLDRLYCKDKGFSADCNRMELIAEDAVDIGLGGRYLHPLLGNSSNQLNQLSLPGARAFMSLHEEEDGRKDWRAMEFDDTSSKLRAECSLREFRQCRSEALASQVAELVGEGSTSGSPIGIAAMLNKLAAAANNTNAVPLHLASELQTGDGIKLAAQSEPVKIRSDHALAIIHGMEGGHTAGGGTAHSACIAVFRSTQACNAINTIAGKTGTPGYSHKTLTLESRVQLCQTARANKAQAKATASTPSPAVQSAVASCTHAPVKWYAALVKTSTEPNAPYTKAVVVLAERNYVQNTGLVDSPYDKGTPNIAAELAWRYFKSSQLIVQPVR